MATTFEGLVYLTAGTGTKDWCNPTGNVGQEHHCGPFALASRTQRDFMADLRLAAPSQLMHYEQTEADFPVPIHPSPVGIIPLSQSHLVHAHTHTQCS